MYNVTFKNEFDLFINKCLSCRISYLINDKAIIYLLPYRFTPPPSPTQTNLATFSSTFSDSLNFTTCLFDIGIQLQSFIPIKPKMRKLWLIFHGTVPGKFFGHVGSFKYIYYISPTLASIQYN